MLSLDTKNIVECYNDLLQHSSAHDLVLGASSDEHYRKRLSHEIDGLIVKLETVRRHLDRDIHESPVDSLREKLGYND